MNKRDAICNQTNIPKTDNTARECDEFISTNCIIHEEAIPYLSLDANANMTEIVTNLVKVLATMQRKLDKL